MQEVDPQLSKYFARRVYLLLKEGARAEFPQQARAFERERLKRYNDWKQIMLEDARVFLVIVVSLAQALFIASVLGYIFAAHCSTRHLPIAEREHCASWWTDFQVSDPIFNTMLLSTSRLVCICLNFVISFTGVWIDGANDMFRAVGAGTYEEFMKYRNVHFCDAIFSSVKT